MRSFLALMTIAILAACQPASTGSGDGGPAVRADVAGSARSGGFDRAEALALAAKARDACAAHMPDTRATRAAFSAAGLPVVGSESRIWLHSPDPFQMIASVNTTARDPGCFIAVRNMSAAEAEALIAPWLAQSGAQAMSSRGSTRRWKGQFAGGPIGLAIVDDFNIPGFLRGRAIVARGL